MKITALIHTRNEESMLPGCLESVAWADEIVVADMASTDATRALAQSAEARIVDMPLAPIVEHVRNQAIAACTHEWVCIVDADERVSPKLAETLKKLAANSDASAWAVPRRNYFLDVWLEHGLWPDHQVRFVRRGKVSWSGRIHEHPEIDGRLEFLPPIPEQALEHVGFINDLPAFIEKRAKYSRVDAQRLADTTRPNIWPYIIRRPLGEFYGRYFKCGGWRHGMHGLIFSMLSAIYEIHVAANYWAMNVKQHTVPAPKALRRQMRWEALRSNSKWLRP